MPAHGRFSIDHKQQENRTDRQQEPVGRLGKQDRGKRLGADHRKEGAADQHRQPDAAEAPRLSSLLLRPFQTSTTYTNLARTRQGVFHVTDDVLLLARAAIGKLDTPPLTVPATSVDGDILADACRWYEFTIESIDNSHGTTWNAS